MDTTTYTAITTRTGTELWKLERRGPRGGREVLYAERRPSATEPTGWELWSDTQRDAGGSMSPAGTFPHAGLYR